MPSPPRHIMGAGGSERNEETGSTSKLRTEDNDCPPFLIGD
jgi:hypothetical protein